MNYCYILVLCADQQNNDVFIELMDEYGGKRAGISTHYAYCAWTKKECGVCMIPTKKC